MNLKNLYQDIIVDHNKNPRNCHALAHANQSADGYNPLCGDKVSIYLQVDDEGIITNASFQGCGCAISTASASLLTEAIKGNSLQFAKDLFECFHQAVTNDDVNNDDALGKLAALTGVREFPSRVKCATLAWHTLIAAISQDQTCVSTE